MGGKKSLGCVAVRVRPIPSNRRVFRTREGPYDSVPSDAIHVVSEISPCLYLSILHAQHRLTIEREYLTVGRERSPCASDEISLLGAPAFPGPISPPGLSSKQ